MFTDIIAATTPVAGRPGSRSVVKALASCLLFLSFAQLPAFADHLHHLWYNNSTWQDQDLTVLTGGAISYGSGVAAFYTTPNQQLHVYYMDTGGYVHQLYYNNTSWSDENLTLATGAPTALIGGISGFAIGNLQYVFYISNSDQHVHELNYNNINWTDYDITSQANGSTANPVIQAFATKPNNQLHVFYQGSNVTDVRQLYFNGTSWSDSDLSTTLGATCPGGQWWAGFATGNFQHIFCAGYGTYRSTLDLLHIYYKNNWAYEDITYRSGGAELAIYPDSGVSGFVAGNKGEIYAVTSDGHLHQYTYAGRWSDTDLTASINAPSKTYGGIVAFPTPGPQFHIYFAPDFDIYQVYYNGTTWAVEDLTGGVGQADYYADITGFNIGNLQHVFYFDTQN